MAANEIVKANGSGQTARQVMPLHALTIDNVLMMAEQAAGSKLFPGITTPQQAFTLMMLCQADGLHPMHAIRRYHIIQGRPTMRADAVQAEFQADGGRIKIIRCDEHEARARFSHPVHQPEGVEMCYTIDQAKAAGLTGGTWKTHPADMLWARLVTKGVRRVHPGVVVGISTPEEVNEVITIEAAHEVAKVEATLPPQRPVPRGDVHVPGQPSSPDGIDPRPYVQVVSEAAAFIGENARAYTGQYFMGELPDGIDHSPKPIDVHRHILNALVQAGHYEDAWPESNQKAIKLLIRLYGAHRDCMREQINTFEREHGERLNGAIEREVEKRRQAALVPPEDESQEAEDETAAEFAELRGRREPGEEG